MGGSQPTSSPHLRLLSATSVIISSSFPYSPFQCPQASLILPSNVLKHPLFSLPMSSSFPYSPFQCPQTSSPFQCPQASLILPSNVLKLLLPSNVLKLPLFSLPMSSSFPYSPFQYVPHYTNSLPNHPPSPLHPYLIPYSLCSVFIFYL